MPLVNSFINKLPFEVHLPGYRFCGPGTKLFKRLQRGDSGLNQLDEACKNHDISYSQANDLTQRHKADKVLADKAVKRFYSKDSNFKEKLAALSVAGIMKVKRKLGLGHKKKTLTFRGALRKARLSIQSKNPKTIISSAKVALKALKGNVQQPMSRIIPLPKTGGLLPLIPVFAALSALGALSGGAAGIAKAVNDAKAASKQLAESERHNKAMEAIALGKGLYLKKIKKGFGVYLTPFESKNY